MSARKDLYDGIYFPVERNFQVFYEGSYRSFTVLDFNRLIAAGIPKNELEGIATQFGFTVIESFFHAIRSEDDLDIFYISSGNSLLLFSYGELQSGRYLLVYEGSYKLNPV